MSTEFKSFIQHDSIINELDPDDTKVAERAWNAALDALKDNLEYKTEYGHNGGINDARC